MIVTNYFVYIHVSRTAGTFLNKLILDHVPGARMVQYHGHLRDLPRAYADLPVIGLVRNPWDWYVSMFFDYRRKRQYVFQIVSNQGRLGFEATVSRFLRLGDGSAESVRLLSELVEAAPTVIDDRTPARRRNPGLRAEDFAKYPPHDGYCSWLFKRMFESSAPHDIHLGRFENLREEALRLLELTGTPITKSITAYLDDVRAMNASPGRPVSYIGGYSPDLEELVADKERYLIERFGYDFSRSDRSSKYPKADCFRDLGTADVDALVERVRKIPDSLWEKGDEEKPNKLNNLNDTRHIMFRFINGFDNVFDFHDFPLWDEWKAFLLPIMEQAARSFGYENYRFPRAMLARLPAGGEISPHIDGMASHFIHKIHVPLITNAETIFRVGAEAKHLPTGAIVEVNNKRNHAVRNGGDLDRVHFIFECYNVDDYGKRA